ncbi:MAG: DUF3014 domain-containing protein [Myxococcales bacterium]|jgi:hypothetical protein
MDRQDSRETASPAARSNLRRSSGPWPVLIAVLLIGGAGGAYWWMSGSSVDTPATAPDAPPQAAAPEVPAAAVEPAPASDAPPLPPVAQADDLIRKALAGISPLGELASWLKTEDLARRFVAAVNAVAEGDSPRSSVAFLAPEGSFATVERGGRTFVDPKSYARYDLVARVFASIDVGALKAAYGRLSPLFEAAYREIGRPGTTWEQTLGRAIGRLLETPVPSGEVELIRPKLVFEFADPQLEKLTPAQKHLLRMGPENMRRVQSKLRAIATSLGVEPGLAGRP